MITKLWFVLFSSRPSKQMTKRRASLVLTENLGKHTNCSRMQEPWTYFWYANPCKRKTLCRTVTMVTIGVLIGLTKEWNPPPKFKCVFDWQNCYVFFSFHGWLNKSWYGMLFDIRIWLKSWHGKILVFRVFSTKVDHDGMLMAARIRLTKNDWYVVGCQALINIGDTVYCWPSGFDQQKLTWYVVSCQAVINKCWYGITLCHVSVFFYFL